MVLGNVGDPFLISPKRNYILFNCNLLPHMDIVIYLTTF